LPLARRDTRERLACAIPVSRRAAREESLRTLQGPGRIRGLDRDRVIPGEQSAGDVALLLERVAERSPRGTLRRTAIDDGRELPKGHVLLAHPEQRLRARDVDLG